MSALGLTQSGSKLTIYKYNDTGTSSGGWGGATTNGGTISLFMGSGRNFNNTRTLIHEAGHIMDWYSRPSNGSNAGSSYQTDWITAGLWNFDTTNWTWNTGDPRGATLLYARRNPGEDFADTFVWYVLNNSIGTQNSGYDDPSRARQSAMTRAINRLGGYIP